MLLPITSTGQNIFQPVDKTLQLLFGYSGIHKGVLAASLNPAALANLNSFRIEAYGERRYLMNEMGLYESGVVIPAGPGNFGLNTSFFGYEAFNKSKLGLAYARNLGKKAAAGLQFSYHALHTEGYRTLPVFNADLGLLLHLNENLHAGWSISNVDGKAIQHMDGLQLPVIYTMGLGYDASPGFFIAGEVRKQENQPAEINAALHYSLNEKFSVSAGISTQTSAVFLSTGFTWLDLHLLMMTGYHPTLGLTPGMQLSYNKRKKRE